MTVSSSTNSVILSANGTAHSFAFTFKIFAAADLQVIVRSTAGVETVKTLNSHYIIADSSVDNANGGNVLFKYNTGTSSDAHYSTTDYRPANNEKVILRRAQPQTQGLDLVANDPFPAESFEESLDKLTFMVQDVQEAVDRSFKFSRSNTLDSSGSSIASSYSEIEENTTSRANKLLSFDSTGVPIATQEIGTLKGNWAASTVYVERDIVKDTSTSDHYIVNTAHTSSGAQPLTTNANAAKYTAITDFSGSIITGSVTTGTLLSTTNGTDNFVAGQNAGDSIASGGNYGVYIGHDAGTAITTGDYNVAIGDQALKTETNTNMTVAIGHKALSAQIQGSSDNNVFSTAVGARAGEDVTTGDSNTLIGGLSGSSLVSGSSNTAVGVYALYSDQLTNFNTAIGYESLYSLNLSSSESSAVSSAPNNTALGSRSGYSLDSGTFNTFLGANSGYYISSGDKNTIVGRFDGNEGGLDIRTSDNYIVLSDGDGNPRLYMTNTGAATFASTVTATGFIIGSADINENDLEAIDGVTAGTVAASKVVTVDTNKDFSGARNITLTGELDAGSLDISGNADIAGTTNLDNTDIDGTLVVDGSNISLDSTSTLNIDNSNTSNGITIGTATSGVPVSIGHSTSETTINDNLNVTGNLVVNGTTQTTNSTTVTIDDPIFTLGGDTAPGSDDNKDRGIEFRYHDGSSSRVGFFGYDDSASAFTVFTAATNSSEVFSGTTGNAIFGNITGTLQTAAQGNITSLGTLTTLTVDNVIINGSTIGHTGDTDLLTVASGVLTVAGEVDATSLDISGDADIDGTLEADAITIGGTAISSVLSPVAGHASIATVGALNSGSITSGFGNINNGSSTITTTGTITGGQLDVDDTDINGSTITFNGSANTIAATPTPSDDGDLILDAAGDITLDADGGDIRLKDGGTQFGKFTRSSGDFIISSSENNKDMKFAGADGGANITALTLDMENAGRATFNGDIIMPRYLEHTGDSDTFIGFPSADTFTITTGATALTVDSSQNVGIGVSDPDHKIEILGANGNQLKLNNGSERFTQATWSSNDSQKGAIWYDATNTDFVVNTQASVDFVVQTGGSNERMKVTSGGTVVIGSGGAADTTLSGATPPLQVIGTGSNSTIACVRREANAYGSNLILAKSRNTSVGSYTIVNDDDGLGSIIFIGDDGTNLDTYGATIAAYVDGTPGEDDLPARLTFSTTADGAASPTERMRIDSSGCVLLGTATTGRALEGADRLTIADASHSGLTIRSGTGGSSDLYGSINFSDQEGGAGEYAGQIWYGHGTLGEKLVLATQGSNRVIVNQNVGIGGDPVSTYSGYDTASLHIRQGSSGGGSQIHLTNAESGHAAGNGSFIGQWQDDDLYITNQESDGEIKISTGGLADIILVSSTGKITTTMTNIDYGLVVKNSHGSSPYCQFNQFSGAAPDNNTNTFLHCSDSSTSRLIIYSDGDVVNHDNSYGSTSDERIKQDIVDANSQWDDIKAVRVRNYKKKDDVDQYGDKAWSQIGVIAQELETVSPKLIKESPPTASDIKHSSEFGTLYEDGDTIPDGKEVGDVKEIKENVKQVSYSVLYMKAIKALQEAMTRIETLEAKVTALEGS